MIGQLEPHDYTLHSLELSQVTLKVVEDGRAHSDHDRTNWLDSALDGASVLVPAGHYVEISV